MPRLAPLLEIALERGIKSTEGFSRVSLRANEHDFVQLPPEMINTDGSLKVYDNLTSLFRPTYRDNKPHIQCSGYVGYIPLNDDFALEIGTRVPVHNLERLVALAEGCDVKLFNQFSRSFFETIDRPRLIRDVLADHLLDTFDHITARGLLKAYCQERRTDSAPKGRILPFQSELLSVRGGKPIAASVIFQRTQRLLPNKILRLAFEKLLIQPASPPAEGTKRRERRLRSAVARLRHIPLPSPSEVQPSSIADAINLLPPQNAHYADALMTAQIILFDAGISLRERGTTIALPAILIKMDSVFERYARNIITQGLQEDDAISVKDGNKHGHTGAATLLFANVERGPTNTPVTPDIVIEVGNKPTLVIDTKYKLAPDNLPAREDINQAVLYAARYNTPRTILLHATRKPHEAPIRLLGKIGGYEVYTGGIDLAAESIADEETKLLEKLQQLLFS